MSKAMTLTVGITRWAARLSALLIAGTFLMFVVGEFVSPHSGPPTRLREWAGIFLLVLTVAAMVAAWKWELTGALVSLAALAVFCMVVHMRRYDVIVAAATPGCLFLLDCILRRVLQQTGS